MLGALEAVVFGLIAGLIGTIALTLSESAEMAITGRAPSTVPGQVANRLLGRDPDDDPGLERRSTIVHWSNGVGTGVVRGLLGLTGLAFVPATIIFFLIFWGGGAAAYKALGIAPWPWQWKGEELAIDLLHKGVYAVATSVAFVLIAQ